MVIADDVTVKHASSAAVAARKVRRLWDMALADGLPLVVLGECGGARIPDMMGAAGFADIGALAYPGHRDRRVPQITVISGDSFGASSFLAAVSDLVIQVRGSCLAVSSPALIASATGAAVEGEALGGVDVHARVTGQISLIADDDAHACELVRAFLAYLPSHSESPAPRAVPREPAPGPSPADIVPASRRRAYDMTKLIAAVVDADSFLELQPLFGRSLLTGLARLDGHAVAVIASQPQRQAGILEPDACDKATRLLCLASAFGLPVVFLHDTPGFMIGADVEHRRLLAKAMLLQQAVALVGVPRLTVIVRKSFGLADHAMSGVGLGSDLLVAWPQAEISFMDPESAARIVMPEAMAEATDPDSAARIATEVAGDVSPYAAAGIMAIDEIIDPDETRATLVAALERAAARPFVPGSARRLTHWPMSW